jgi:hypothetical protein
MANAPPMLTVTPTSFSTLDVVDIEKDIEAN